MDPGLAAVVGALIGASGTIVAEIISSARRRPPQPDDSREIALPPGVQPRPRWPVRLRSIALPALAGGVVGGIAGLLLGYLLAGRPEPELPAVALMTDRGRYVSAMMDRDGSTGKVWDWALRGSAPEIKEWELFAPSCLEDGTIALQSSHGKYVSALNDEGDRDWRIRADTTEVLAWEKFTLIDPQTALRIRCPQAVELLHEGDVTVALRTYHGGYVTVMNVDYVDPDTGEEWGLVLRAEPMTGTVAPASGQRFTLILVEDSP